MNKTTHDLIKKLSANSSIYDMIGLFYKINEFLSSAEEERKQRKGGGERESESTRLHPLVSIHIYMYTTYIYAYTHINTLARKILPLL